MAQLTVADLMSRDVITLEKDENLNLAEEVMRLGRLRHLPVVDRGRLMGLVTHRDLLRCQASSLAALTREARREIQRSIRAEDIMTTDVITVTADTVAVEAARLMRRHKIGCLPVVDGGTLIGILTEADFLDLVITALHGEPV